MELRCDRKVFHTELLPAPLSVNSTSKFRPLTRPLALTLITATLALANPPAHAGSSSSDSVTAQVHLMTGEMAAGRNQPGLAASEFLQALQTIRDPELAARADRQLLMENGRLVSG